MEGDQMTRGNPNQKIICEILRKLGHSVSIKHNQIWVDENTEGWTIRQAQNFIDTKYGKSRPNVIRVARGKHDPHLAYHLLREGENGAQLWHRLPIPEFKVTPDRIWKFVKVGVGKMTGAVVAITEPGGPRAYSCGFQRWDGKDFAILDVVYYPKD